jgi:hypothetical protein
MNMKIASIKLLAAILLSAMAILPLRAQTDAPDGGADSNAAIAREGSVVATNAGPASNSAAVRKIKARNGSNNSPPVRIDSTGIHVGGAEPVDINFPNGWNTGLGLGKTSIA